MTLFVTLSSSLWRDHFLLFIRFYYLLFIAFLLVVMLLLIPRLLLSTSWPNLSCSLIVWLSTISLLLISSRYSHVNFMNRLLSVKRSKWIFLIGLFAIGLGFTAKNVISYPIECTTSGMVTLIWNITGKICW